MVLSPRAVAPLLFGSGFCALIYQVTWTREFRLIFGASTAASAAVLAIFVGGLGVGGVWLGGRADGERRPLELYARLEALAAALAAATPLLLWLARRLYTALGGTVALGLGGGTVLRLVLATLVLAGPTVAMGGTLPAAVRAVSSPADTGRRGAALLYGVNTLGAVTGSVLSTFALLEVFGARLTLWMACLVNLLVAVFALRVSRDGEVLPEAAAGADAPAGEALAPAAFTLGAAAATGFAFFLLELVWYRMLGPILGGSVFTFGLVLAVALLGIGLGGALYARRDRGAPTLGGFAASCLLESALVMVPFALGDRVAVLAQTLRGLEWMGFGGQVLGWAVVASLVVLPAAVVSGYQFPVLLGLLGRGREGVGRQVGLAYACNTAGAVVGSLAGGFGLIPLLGAPGCWRLAALTLAGLGAGALALGARRAGGGPAWLAPAGLLVASLALQVSPGPSGLWRHSGIGVGRLAPIDSPEKLESARRDVLRSLVWEHDGVESSVAVVGGGGLSFIVNGKSDGNTQSDAGTQVMAGLLGVALQPEARRSLVIGLGTGSTAGWLGVVPTMEQVDVVEIEPTIVRVARDSAAVNQRVLEQRKVRMLPGDAREVLLSSSQRYDIIFSEPSNPYRAGIASLFTQEFYRAASERLAPRGLFLQWVQAYDITPRTAQTIMATLHSVFPVVDVWVLDTSDLLLVASHEPHPIEPASTRALLAAEPFRSALPATWATSGLEGLLAHHLASPPLVDLVARQHGESLNTDDLSPVEFGVARTVGQTGLFSVGQLEGAARSLGLHQPLLAARGDVDLEALEVERAYRLLLSSGQLPEPGSLPAGSLRQRLGIARQHTRGNHERVRALWSALPTGTALRLPEQVFVADSLALLGDEQASAVIDGFAPLLPLEALLLRAELRAAQQRPADAAELLLTYFHQHRDNPWVWLSLSSRPLNLAARLGADPAIAARLLPVLLSPFAVQTDNELRLTTALALAAATGDPRLCVQALEPLEPHFPWHEEPLRLRLDCYAATGHPRLERARADLSRWLDQRAAPFTVEAPRVLPPPGARSARPALPPPGAAPRPASSAWADPGADEP